MRDIPPDLIHRLRMHRQEHVVRNWETLGVDEQMELVGQLAGINFEQLGKLYAVRDQSDGAPDPKLLQPVPMEDPSTISREAYGLGCEAVARGEVAVLLVAGGQGSRLGFDKPKGMFSIAPISGKSLFQIHAEKVFALGRRFGRPIPFLVMTSPATHDDTESYFREHGYFGLGRENTYFFQQGTMPAVEIDTGRLLMEKPGRVFTSPNGHGGTLTALSETGLLGELIDRRIRTLFYFQVDNPLVKVADPAFLGRHLEMRSEASSKAVSKAYPKEKMGVLALINGRCGIVEYSDLPEPLTVQLDDQGRLKYRAGSPAIHLFDTQFLRRITEGSCRLPFHIARKKVPYLDQAGETVQPATENGLKFEMFIFDALPMAERTLVLETPRDEEFAPVKNASGVDSPESARQAMMNLVARWLEECGLAVPRDNEGNAAVPLEISPRFALDARELVGRIWPGRVIDRPTYLE